LSRAIKLCNSSAKDDKILGMRVLVAEDDPINARLLEAALVSGGYKVLVCRDGLEAWCELEREDPPPICILDWMMPGMDGVEVCRRVRERFSARPQYLMLLTARGNREDIVSGLRAGADDYITKPFDRDELIARVQVGRRVIELQRKLAERLKELEEALAQVRQLQGLLPICSYCKRIRDDQSYWHQLESFISEHSGAQFSHSICPECYDAVVKGRL
jgi:sigma-B regulation protein RsbU (phosphoserine phosphatase)